MAALALPFISCRRFWERPSTTWHISAKSPYRRPGSGLCCLNERCIEFAPRTGGSLDRSCVTVGSGLLLGVRSISSACCTIVGFCSKLCAQSLSHGDFMNVASDGGSIKFIVWVPWGHGSCSASSAKPSFSSCLVRRRQPTRSQRIQGVPMLLRGSEHSRMYG